MTFGQRLGMLRKERGYTQKTFAQELSVTERCIRAYENEMRHPDYFGLIALADYFNVSLTIWSDAPTAGSATRRGGLYGRPRATTRVAPTAFYEAERNLYLDLLHLVAASFRSLALPLTAKLAPSAASPLRAKPASLGSGPVQAAGTALHPDLLHRSVKKICLRQIFSVGRSGFAARREPRSMQGYTSICSIR